MPIKIGLQRIWLILLPFVPNSLSGEFGTEVTQSPEFSISKSRPIFLVIVLLIVFFAIILSINRWADNNVEVSDNKTSVAEVTGIIDGDTFFIRGGEKVRLICVDAPEFKDAGYWEARNFLEDKIKHKNITLVKDVSEKDSYGRLLRYAYLDGVFINELLVKEGLAKAFPYGQDIYLCPKIREAEEYAKDKKLGVWNSSNMVNSGN